MSTKKDKPATFIITGKVRFSYCNVFQSRAMNEGDKPKYSVCLLISKKDKATLKKIKKAIKAAEKEGIAKHGSKFAKNMKMPLRDGDEEREDDENYKGMMFVNASSLRKPSVVDEEREPLYDVDEFYSGCHGRASLNFYPFSVNGNKGVAAGLNNLQKLADGDRLSGGSSAEDDFGDDYEDNDDLM